MKLSTYYKFKKPEGSDIVDVNDLSENFEAIDQTIHDVAQNTGDLSNGHVYTSQAGTRANLASGETMATMIGKVMKWFSDLKAGAFSQVANGLTISTEGYVLDARQGKALKDSIDAIATSFQAGCRVIARAITAGRGTYSNPVNGVATDDNASPDTMATNVKTLATTNYNAGVAATKVGTAVAADVLTGKTFTNASGVGIAGGMADYTGSSRKSVAPTGGTGNETLTLDVGKHDSVVVNRTAPYNSGYTAGQNSIKNGTAVTLSVGSYDATNKRYTVTTNTNAYVGGTAKTLNVSATAAYNAGQGDVTLHKVAVGNPQCPLNDTTNTWTGNFKVDGVTLSSANFFLVVTQVAAAGFPAQTDWGWTTVNPTISYNASTGAVTVTGLYNGGSGHSAVKITGATLYCVYTKPAKSFTTTK